MQRYRITVSPRTGLLIVSASCRITYVLYLFCRFIGSAFVRYSYLLSSTTLLLIFTTLASHFVRYTPFINYPLRLFGLL